MNKFSRVLSCVFGPCGIFPPESEWVWYFQGSKSSSVEDRTVGTSSDCSRTQTVVDRMNVHFNCSIGQSFNTVQIGFPSCFMNFVFRMPLNDELGEMGLFVLHAHK